MIKSELLKEWQEDASKYIPCELSMVNRDALLNTLCKVIADELADGGEVSLPHIGKLKVRDMPARDGRNPRTGEAITIPAKKKAVLVPSAEFKAELSAV